MDASPTNPQRVFDEVVKRDRARRCGRVARDQRRRHATGNRRIAAGITPTEGVTVILRWTDPEGNESSRKLHAPASGSTFTSNLGPFSEGSITWWVTATDSRDRNATTIHHLVAVNVC
jgi:hypothetical protein